MTYSVWFATRDLLLFITERSMKQCIRADIHMCALSVVKVISPVQICVDTWLTDIICLKNSSACFARQNLDIRNIWQNIYLDVTLCMIRFCCDGKVILGAWYFYKLKLMVLIWDINMYSIMCIYEFPLNILIYFWNGAHSQYQWTEILGTSYVSIISFTVTEGLQSVIKWRFKKCKKKKVEWCT